MLKLDRIENGFYDRYPDRIVTIDSHTQGEPTRLLIGGLGPLPGDTMKAKRDHFESHFDTVRMLLTREPRGHRGIMAAVVTEPVSPEGQFGLFYMDARRYPYLCGHATIGAVATLVEAGALETGDGERQIVVDTPSGPLSAHTRIQEGRVVSVAIDMVPSFVFDTERELAIEGFGKVPVDLVCVGGFFAMVSARAVGLDLVPANKQRFISLGMAVIDAANQRGRLVVIEGTARRVVRIRSRSWRITSSATRSSSRSRSSSTRACCGCWRRGKRRRWRWRSGCCRRMSARSTWISPGSLKAVSTRSSAGAMNFWA